MLDRHDEFNPTDFSTTAAEKDSDMETEMVIDVDENKDDSKDSSTDDNNDKFHVVDSECKGKCTDILSTQIRSHRINGIKHRFNISLFNF